jgi:hypothetical protein
MQEYLEPLRAYATEPPAGAPPEILPWDHADPWGLDGAARGALGLILAGEVPGPRLYAVADYLLTFGIEGYGAQMFPDAPLLNGAALALCGYLAEGRHPEAELWRLAGCARLASQVHWRKAALNDRVAADCLLAVAQVAEELELPVLADIITLRERMFGRLLDHSRAERLHVSEADYPAHMAQPVPAEEVGALMRGRDWQWTACAREFRPPDIFRAEGGREGPPADLREADETCRNLLTLRAHMLVRHQFGSEIDWHLRLFDDVESTVSLGHMPFIRNLAAAYVETGEERYAFHAARLLWSFYRVSPVPNHRQPQGPWRTLEVGNRQCTAIPDVLGCLGMTEPFDEALHSMLARSRLEHMRFLLAHSGGAGNWYQVECAGLAAAALYSPELRLADAYLRVALRRLRWINSFAYHDDGFQFELTHGYHIFPTSAMFNVVRMARARGVALPDDFVDVVAKAHEMYLYAQQPDHLLPMFNDCNPQPLDPAPLLRAAAEVYGRDDFRWGATHGEEGEPPDHASHAWPSAGYYCLRSGWGEEDQYLFFDGAAWGAAHQHEDKLSFVLHAGGRTLIGDPNIYSYSRTELTHYFRSSRAHNVVLIDRMEQARKHRPEAKLETLGRNEWVSRDAFDFVSSEYLEGYAPNPYEPLPAPPEVDTSLSHRRAIWYVKGEYWILCDLIRGADAAEHTLEQIYHLAPIYEPGAAVPFRAGEVSARPEEILTRDEGLANLAILPVDRTGLSVRAEKGQTSPAVGWYGVLGEYPAWDVTLEARTALPARLDAVLYPVAAGADPGAHPTVTRLRADGAVTALRIRGEGIDDLFLLCEEGAGAVEVDGVAFEGRALLVRRAPALRAYAVAPGLLRVEGREVTPEA